MYRQHLANVYRALRLAPPEELSRPILTIEERDLHEAPSNPIHPTIDGEVTSYFEWMGAGLYRPDVRSGAMHGSQPEVRELYYGIDRENLYVRLDFQGSPQFTTIELRTEGAAISLLDNSAVRFAHRKILEFQVPLHVLGIWKNQRIRFQLVLLSGNLPLDTIPQDGWIELDLEPAG